MTLESSVPSNGTYKGEQQSFFLFDLLSTIDVFITTLLRVIFGLLFVKACVVQGKMTEEFLMDAKYGQLNWEMKQYMNQRRYLQ